MEKKKKLSTESNLGPLLRGNGHYAYNSEGVTDHYSKGPGENTVQLCMPDVH